MVRALLTHRNTPDAGCKLSPAQILLGRPLRDTLPFLNKDVMAFNNPQVNPQWREAWKAKEEALRERYVKTIETLNEHAHPLPPLRHGDSVMIQNQRGRFPKKWDNSGVVVETKPNDQYVVKLAGSGRLTLRNRRFLRQYNPHLLHGTKPSTSTPTVVAPVPKEVHYIPNHPHPQTCERPLPHTATSSVVHPSMQTPLRETQQQSGDVSTPHCRVLFGNLPSPCGTPTATPSSDVPPVIFSPQTRPVRTRVSRKMYDANSGTYKVPSAVPETV